MELFPPVTRMSATNQSTAFGNDARSSLLRMLVQAMMGTGTFDPGGRPVNVPGHPTSAIKGVPAVGKLYPGPTTYPGAATWPGMYQE